MPIQCKNPLQLEGIAKIGFANNERLLSLHALYYGIALTHPRAFYPLEHKTLWRNFLGVFWRALIYVHEYPSLNRGGRSPHLLHKT